MLDWAAIRQTLSANRYPLICYPKKMVSAPAAPTPEKLLVYSRYPVAGQTKTRLIPALGADGAARLQHQLTEQTLNTVAGLLAARPLGVEIRYTGGSLDQMRTWLHDRWPLVEQGDGDLGQRLEAGFHAAFAAGCQRVAAIGCDCPSLSAALLARAFSELANHELVLGPARDGGYYLIGLNRPAPPLFSDIPWGSSHVLTDTCRRAEALGLSMAMLPELRDVDRPEDLPALSRPA